LSKPRRLKDELDLRFGIFPSRSVVSKRRTDLAYRGGNGAAAVAEPIAFPFWSRACTVHW